MDKEDLILIVGVIVGVVVIILGISTMVYKSRADAREKNFQLEKMRIEYQYLGEPTEVGEE